MIELLIVLDDRAYVLDAAHRISIDDCYRCRLRIDYYSDNDEVQDEELEGDDVLTDDVHWYGFELACCKTAEAAKALFDAIVDAYEQGKKVFSISKE